MAVLSRRRATTPRWTTDLASKGMLTWILIVCVVWIVSAVVFVWMYSRWHRFQRQLDERDERERASVEPAGTDERCTDL